MESADTEIRFDLKKMQRELEPFLAEYTPADRTAKRPLENIVLALAGGRTKQPTRRYPNRDWRIYDEVYYWIEKMPYGELNLICDTVSEAWKPIGWRRVRNLYYELRSEDRPTKYSEPPEDKIIEKYPQLAKYADRTFPGMS